MTEDAQVRDNADESRYEIRVGGELAGFTRYTLHGDPAHVTADFTHTEIGDEYGGRGLASELIREALDDARRRKWQVLPYCRFVREFIAKNREYADLVPTAQHERFGLTG
jgi:uncharacterized protein